MHILITVWPTFLCKNTETSGAAVVPRYFALSGIYSKKNAFGQSYNMTDCNSGKTSIEPTNNVQSLFDNYSH